MVKTAEEVAYSVLEKMATSLTMRQIREDIPAPYSEVALSTPLSEVGVSKDKFPGGIPGEKSLSKQNERLFGDAFTENMKAKLIRHSRSAKAPVKGGSKLQSILARIARKVR
jgi:hypothetical protein